MANKMVVITVFLIITFTSCGNVNSENDSSEMEQQQSSTDNTAASAILLPSFSVQDINGKIIDLHSLKGKKLFVNLWASWCPPCKREMPSIEKLYRSVDTGKVAFLLVSLDDRFEKAKKYVASKKLKLPIYYPAQNLPELFNVQGIPATFIFNEKAELIKRVDGSDDYDTDLYRTLFQ